MKLSFENRYFSLKKGVSIELCKHFLKLLIVRTVPPIDLLNLIYIKPKFVYLNTTSKVNIKI